MTAFINSGISLWDYKYLDFRAEHNVYREKYFPINNYNETSARTTLKYFKNEFYLFIKHKSK